jgi:2-C-methyl-D-erythritol 4-phosphate cytidylyltransferase
MNRTAVSVVIVAGGVGSRMQGAIPKQFMLLEGMPIIHYSCAIFELLPEVVELVIVCDPAFRDLCRQGVAQKPLKFALPGERRQDSLYNGLQKCDAAAQIICVHDAARPLIDAEIVQQVIAAASVGAAAAAVPVKSTVKEVDADGFVVRTPPRSGIWEVQTPQAVLRPWLDAGFALASQYKLTVTDDVSLAELAGCPVRLVPSSYRNIKITTPEDLQLAALLLGRGG